MSSTRYQIIGPWREVSTTHASFDRFDTNYGEWDVIVEQADAHDTRTNTTYTGGAYRVRTEGPSPKPRAKTFIGESAWNNSARHAEDIAAQLRNRPAVRA